MNVYDDLREIYLAGVERVDPYRMIREQVRLEGSILSIMADEKAKTIDLDSFDSIIILGAGKATSKMAKAMEAILGERITEGLISVKRGHTEELAVIETIEAGHPVPDQMSLEGGRRIAELCRKGDGKTLFICLISGGGSALLNLPGTPGGTDLSLDDMQRTTEALLSCGATIQEMNCIRKHLSRVKGGRLAELMYPAASLNLILSDVVGDPLDSIASGPTVGDPSTFRDAIAIIDAYDLSLPEKVVQILQDGSEGRISETPPPGNAIFVAVENILIGTNRAALKSAAKKAETLGYSTMVLSSRITGEAREIARVFSGIGRDIRSSSIPLKPPACVIAGGETTVTLNGKGKGGRNQEMSLAFLCDLQRDPGDAEGVFFLSGATDGNDGPTDAAGAFASLEILEEAVAAGLDSKGYLRRNDSYNFFSPINRLLLTGPTNTNVCDLQILIVN
ncbi:MAG: glycerate kinase [Spirochaetales bacterium]|nr:glycerate kinase [Spirochaetales bacterium]